MRKGNISRAEAFRHIWQLSRKTRKPLVAVAQALLEIGDDPRATD
jgi:AmiR/NasT family two-component response regulator